MIVQKSRWFFTNKKIKLIFIISFANYIIVWCNSRHKISSPKLMELVTNQMVWSYVSTSQNPCLHYRLTHQNMLALSTILLRIGSNMISYTTFGWDWRNTWRFSYNNELFLYYNDKVTWRICAPHIWTFGDAVVDAIIPLILKVYATPS